MLNTSHVIKGSYRDPSGHVYRYGDDILRTVLSDAKQRYEWARDQGIYQASQEAGYLVATTELKSGIPDALSAASYVLKHRLIEYVSWPYEWSFFQLRAAALHHLDFQLFLFDRGAVLTDASAYNIQFIGKAPVFIDALSIRRYREGEYWEAHRQFCEQFLNPLLLRSLKGVAHNAWYRGGLEGIATRDLSALLSWREKMSLNVLTHVVLQASLENKALSRPDESVRKAKAGKGLSKIAYRGILQQLRKWIAGLEPRNQKKTVWGDYETNNTYLADDVTRKSETVARFCQKHKPNLLFDIGCNSGYYSSVALKGGANYVVGFDFDIQAVERAWFRPEHKDRFLPLWLDASNPSPGQGWRQAEREGFYERSKADALVALAFEHHLAIGKNVPLPQVVDWLVSLAPRGLVEFVPKNDSTVQQLLSLREDIFPDYHVDHFKRALSEKARIVELTQVTDSGRVLIEYERSR